ncbi:MAG: SbtA family thio(seleno)oxazole RiPP natural product precursor [Desulfohalobiaceae bacterium]
MEDKKLKTFLAGCCLTTLLVGAPLAAPGMVKAASG